MGVLAGLLSVMCVTVAPAVAHETDQYTLPAGRDFADQGNAITARFYRAIAGGVEQANAGIRAAGGDAPSLQSSDGIASAVNKQFPIALFFIESWDKSSLSEQARQRNPGRLVGYKPIESSVRRYAEFSLNPFRAWPCATIRAFDVYMGTDKIGHFTDMGMIYYRDYRAALAKGANPEQAVRKAIALGTEGIISERGVLGLMTAGAYSNADLVANYCGMLFYVNLTEPVTLKGHVRPPMLLRDGPYWRIAPHVRPDSDFFSWFISEHFDEALNPSVYQGSMRAGIERAVREHAEDVLYHRADVHGNRRSREFFAQKARELRTYYGAYYGHSGGDSDLITIASACFDAPPTTSDVHARDSTGFTALHHAADSGDIEAARRLLDAGADANAPVRSDERRSPEWGSTPLHCAARSGNAAVARLLIARGADVNVRSDAGATPLHRAIAHPAVADLLIDSGAQLNVADARGRSPLHWCAIDPSAAAMDLLLSRGANVNARDMDGGTPLLRATEANHAHAVQRLLEQGADPNIGDAFAQSPLHVAVRRRAPDLAQTLLNAGAAVDAADAFGRTPLHAAVSADRPRLVTSLVEHGAVLDVADAYGLTPLHLADRNGHDSLAGLLRETIARQRDRSGDGGRALSAAADSD